MNETLSKIELKLNSYDGNIRKQALGTLARQMESGEIEIVPPSRHINMHCHTFYSYNPDNDSPSMIAWRAKKAGLFAAGIVDFDVLDGVDEFIEAGRTLGLRTIAGIETRVYLEEYSNREINSPGEPGVAYHVGAGMPSAIIPAIQKEFLHGLREKSQQRNREMIAKVNSFTAPVEIEYEQDVLPLTPNGNATERHICLAYARRASEMYKDTSELRSYWSKKLGSLPDDIDLPTGCGLQALIRKHCMKKGGAGYIAPDSGSFPKMHEFNQFVVACGGVPTLAWLDGSTAGESRLKEILQLEISMGVSAVNLIPDRNFNAGKEDWKLSNLYDFVETADRFGLPVLAGTELNAPGLKFVDDFDSAELSPLLPIFTKGAMILYAHTMLQRSSAMGFCSPWGEINFPDPCRRCEFYQAVGEDFSPLTSEKNEINPEMKPDEVLRSIKEN